VSTGLCTVTNNGDDPDTPRRRKGNDMPGIKTSQGAKPQRREVKNNSLFFTQTWRRQYQSPTHHSASNIAASLLFHLSLNAVKRMIIGGRRSKDGSNARPRRPLLRQAGHGEVIGDALPRPTRLCDDDALAGPGEAGAHAGDLLRNEGPSPFRRRAAVEDGVQVDGAVVPCGAELRVVGGGDEAVDGDDGAPCNRPRGAGRAPG
jgi:hypothetical protein